MGVEGIIWLRDVMTESKPKFRSLEELVEFFDTHDLGDYWDHMPEAHFEIDIRRRTHLFAINDELAEQLTVIARARQVPSEQLINVWLREKLLEQVPAAL